MAVANIPNAAPALAPAAPRIRGEVIEADKIQVATS
jgi:hypothetical protein